MTPFRRAREFAERSNADNFRHGAIILKKGRFICGAENLPFKTHTRGSGLHRSSHAEIRAILKARAILNTNDLHGCLLVVVRINKNGDFRLSKPCSDCWTWINAAGLDVEWSENAKIG